MKALRSNNPLLPEDVAPIVEQLRERARKAGGCCKWLDADFEGDAALGARSAKAAGGWAHVEEIADPPAFVVDGYDASDVQQGSLGDCWFLAAVAIAADAEDGKYLKQSILVNEYNQEGVYCFQFFKDGYFIPVFVDDRIPTRGGAFIKHGTLYKGVANPAKGKMRAPCFATSSAGQELWILLYEKAYAKVFGSYKALDGGCSHRALMDITGGSSRKYSFKREAERASEMTDGSMVRRLQRFLRDGYMLAAGSAGHDDSLKNEHGIVQGHAYSVLDVREVDGSAFVRLRNPWGSKEWLGKYSDHDAASWTASMKAALEYDPETADSNDGAFWMGWDDFGDLRNYTSIMVCRNFPLRRSGGAWRRYLTHDQFDRSNDGGCTSHRSVKRSPQYTLQFAPDSGAKHVTVVIQLQQKDWRGTAADKVALGLMLVDNEGRRIQRDKRGEVLLDVDGFRSDREVTIEGRISLDKCNVPLTLLVSTYYKHRHTSYTLTVYVKGGGLARVGEESKFLPLLPPVDG